jgi:hypothetical protein
MKLLLVASVDPWTRSVASVHRFVAAGCALGHEVAVYGEPNGQLPDLRCTTDLDGVDCALVLLQVAWDLPDMPLLAHLLDGVPRARRVALDMWGRFNDTIRLEHDFNHLEKLDGHAGWEWEEAFAAISDTVLQPTLAPLRPAVRSFLFHGYDQASLAAPHRTAREAAAAWTKKDYGAAYVGSNWQRWEQVRRFLEGYAPVREKAGAMCLAGWDWSARPDWAVKMGMMGIDTDPALLARLAVEVRDGVRFDEVVGLLSRARFAPVIHRPLFRHLGLVTNRTFETFLADTVPVLMLPRDFVAAMYGETALALVPGNDIAAHLDNALSRPEQYWDAVLQTRSHLAKHHSYAQRVRELEALIKDGATAEATR